MTRGIDFYDTDFGNGLKLGELDLTGICYTQAGAFNLINGIGRGVESILSGKGSNSIPFEEYEKKYRASGLGNNLGVDIHI